jgi:hypothetical protein
LFSRLDSPTPPTSFRLRRLPSSRLPRLHDLFGPNPPPATFARFLEKQCGRGIVAHNCLFIWPRFFPPGYTPLCWISAPFASRPKDVGLSTTRTCSRVVRRIFVIRPPIGFLDILISSSPDELYRPRRPHPHSAQAFSPIDRPPRFPSPATTSNVLSPPRDWIGSYLIIPCSSHPTFHLDHRGSLV